MCDGLGACLGHCPENAIEVEEREAEPYDEKNVMINIVKAGPNTIKAHLSHLKDHNQIEYYQQAIDYLKENNIQVQKETEVDMDSHNISSCPGSRPVTFAPKNSHAESQKDKRPSQLSHWPIQMHLISPNAPHYHQADVLLTADCVAFTTGDFHMDFLAGKKLIIACPKLDHGQETYLEKLKSLIDQAKINTLTVIIMQVPCCGGLLQLAQKALSQSSRKIPIKCIMVSLQGDVLKDEWL